MNLISIACAIVGQEISLTLFQSNILEEMIAKLPPETQQALDYNPLFADSNDQTKGEAEARYHKAIDCLRENRMLHDILLLSANDYPNLIRLCAKNILDSYRTRAAEESKSQSPLYEDFLDANIYADIHNSDGIYYGHIGPYHKNSLRKRTPQALEPIYSTIIRRKQTDGKSARPIWLDTRYVNMLANNDIRTHRQLLKYLSPNRLANCFGIGEQSARVIERYFEWWTEDLK